MVVQANNSIPDNASKLSNKVASLSRTDLWFSDGNIVLITGSLAFKVHRGQLERHSEVFDGMFGIPQPGGQDTVDGCLCVELHDSPDDVYHFLSALYDGLYVPKPLIPVKLNTKLANPGGVVDRYFSSPRHECFPRLASVLRLSSKYFVSQLRDLCLERLALDWPCTLEGWDARETEAITPKGGYTPREYTPHPVLVIELALDLGLTHLLPSAFYDLSRYGPSKIMQGTPGIKSAIPNPNDQSEPLQVRLSGDLFVRTLRGRERAQQFLYSFLCTQVENREPCADCAHRRRPQTSIEQAHPCVQAFNLVAFSVFRCIGGIAVGRDADPLFTLFQCMERLMRADILEGERARRLMCTPCKLNFLDDCMKERSAAWMAIPGWFGLANDSRNGWGGDEIVEKEQEQEPSFTE